MTFASNKFKTPRAYFWTSSKLLKVLSKSKHHVLQICMFSNFDSEHLRTGGASADLSAFRMQTVESGTAPQMPWAVILRIQTSLVHLPHHGTNCPMGSQWAHILTKTDRDLNVLSLVEDWQSSNNSKPRNSSAFLSGCRSRDFVRKAWRKERACLGGKMGQAAPIKIKILQRSAKCQGHPRTTSSKVTSAYTGDWCPLLKNSIYLQLHGILICLRATGPKTDLDDFRMRGCDLVVWKI